MILVSACLLGVNCRYDGKNSKSDELMKLIKNYEVIPVCPEQLGGLTTPRNPVEISRGNGKDVLEGSTEVIDAHNREYTENFVKGAEETLKIAKLSDVKFALLKAKSPSCGRGEIYDGSFSGKRIKGNGVTAQLLLDNGIEVYNENQIAELLEKLNEN